MTKPDDPLLPGTSHAQFAYRWSAWLDDTKQASFGQTRRVCRHPHLRRIQVDSSSR